MTTAHFRQIRAKKMARKDYHYIIHPVKKRY